MKKEEMFLSVKDSEKLSCLCKALSSPTRIDILNILLNSPMNISEVSSALNLPISSVAKHINLLEDAGLIHVNFVPGVRGSQKICLVMVDTIHIDVFSSLSKFSENLRIYTYSMPIGNYFDFNVTPPCGLISDKDYIGSTDTVYSFYDPQRTQAQLLWFFSGWIEYRFPSIIFRNNSVESIQISMELCSEAPEYCMVWPSDLTIELNSIPCAMITLPGDYGDRRGRLNPKWWSGSLTQYGDQYLLSVNQNETSVNGRRVSPITLSDLSLQKQDYLSLRLKIDGNAENVGGINIFGSSFGEFEQHIELEVSYYP